MSAVSRIGRRRVAAKEDASEVYQKRRKEIAEASVRVFNRLGFTGASISAVAAELGIDRASLYYYIGSKEELFDAIVREVIEGNSKMVHGIASGSKSPPDKLRDIIIALMKSFGQHYPLIYIYIREDLSHVSDRRSSWSKQMRKLNRAVEDDIIAVIEEGHRDKTLRYTGPSRVVAYGILGIIGWTNRWFHPDTSEVNAEQVGTIYANMILSGLAAA